jgi:hypothetical protein
MNRSPFTSPTARSVRSDGQSREGSGGAVVAEERIVRPELLDSLPETHPDAVASRRDLRRINFIMGNFRWLEKQVAHRVTGDEPILEIGAGDGGLARRLCAGNSGLAERYHALDLAPRPDNWPAGAHWHQTDLWSEAGAELLSRARIVVANMVLHHFEEEHLRRLGGMLSRCRVILACEPSRRSRHIWQGRLLFPFINRVTRHDMVVSIRAGFRGGELASCLGPAYAGQVGDVRETWIGAYRAVLRGPAN